MEGFLYDDDIENGRRLATIEASINRTLLYDEEKRESSFKNMCGCLTYIIAGAIIVMVIIVLIIVIKHST